MDKGRIDRIRDSGGFVDIGTTEDGAIIEMINVNDRLIVVKERSVYELMMADDIDPNRTNVGLPNGIHKLIVTQGSDSEIVSRIFLTAKTLFRKGFFQLNINIEAILWLSIGIVQELIALEKEIAEYVKNEQAVSAEYENARTAKGPYAIPSIPNLETSCKTLFQKVNHVEQLLMEIVTFFYQNEKLPKGKLDKHSHLSSLAFVAEAKYGPDDPFTKFLIRIQEFMKIVRELRNSLDHRLDFVAVKDFDIQPDSTIISPTIELNHKIAKLERVSLSSFLPTVMQNMVAIVETIFAYLASRNANGHIMAQEVREIPEEKRRYKFVKYCFWSPIGEGGYYNQ